MAKSYNADIYIGHINPAQYASEYGISIQMAARELRYNWLETVRNKNGFSSIATAHHKDDSIETILINLTKGTGIRGLHGILPKQNRIIRPLLFAFRQDIEYYAILNHIQYREDTTNRSLKYERNYLRHQVIPALETLNPSFQQTMAANIKHFQDAEILYEQGLSYYRKKLMEKKGDLIYIPIKKIDQYPAIGTILFELLAPYGFFANQIEQIQQVLHEQAGKQFFSEKYRLIKDRTFLVISPKGEKEAGPFAIPLNRKQLTLTNEQFHFQKGPSHKIKIKSDPGIGFIDFDQLSFPLILRRWQEGDYFYPLVNESKGDKPKKKKLKRFFTDQKLSIPEKENVWLLTSGKQIVWVVGYRLDNRFKVTSHTKTIYKVKWKEK
ncbi:MAG: tRNA lysidine(34) synthetase TilS [Bacteroidetes bacterium SW_11_45_7]|nr:MAG: tRNA lysidine(34) synthetase TilS [Bacteroidetes bacterium SW_11_45_7]